MICIEIYPVCLDNGKLINAASLHAICMIKKLSCSCESFKSSIIESWINTKNCIE